VEDRSDDGGVIHNSGLIKTTSANDTGIWVRGAAGLTTTINNQAGGAIQSVDWAIFTTDGRISLTNRGSITGLIECNATDGNVNDVIVNRGKISGAVLLGAGNDTFTGVGAATSGKVFGEDGADKLTGGSTANQLDGGAGTDTLRGGLGKDTLTGGANRDFFDFNSKSESVTGSNRDLIRDLSRADDDRIDLGDIDADTSSNSGNDTFKFVGKAAFKGGGGELRYVDNGSTCYVQGDINGDKKADFEIKVMIGSLEKGDFFL
jgi:serralysin